MTTVKTGLTAGAVGGALDLIAAMVVYPAISDARALQIPQSVASGVLGHRAFEGGGATVLLGILLHFVMACGAGLTLTLAMKRLALLRASTLVTGAGFGIAVYFFMQWVVLPLSRAAVQSPDAARLTLGLAIHVLAIGLPMTLVVQQMACRDLCHRPARAA